MDQLNNFMTKIFVFEKDVPYKASGLKITLRIPNTLCLIHMNRKGTIKEEAFKLGHANILWKKSSQSDLPACATGRP